MQCCTKLVAQLAVLLQFNHFHLGHGLLSWISTTS